MRHFVGREIEIGDDRTPAARGHEAQLARLVRGGDQVAEDVARDPFRGCAQAGDGPRDLLAADIALGAEDFQLVRERGGKVAVEQIGGGCGDLAPDEPRVRFHGAEELRAEVADAEQDRAEDGQQQPRVAVDDGVFDERESAEHGHVFREAHGDIGEGLGRMVHDEARAGLHAVRHQRHAAEEQHRDHVEDRVRRAEHAHGEECAADRPDHGMHGVPERIDPRHFVREELHGEEHAGDGDDGRMAEDGELGIALAHVDPLLLDGEARGEDGEIQIDAGERREAERDRERLERVHGRNIGPGPAITIGNSTRPPPAPRRRDSTAPRCPRSRR